MLPGTLAHWHIIILMIRGSSDALMAYNVKRPMPLNALVRAPGTLINAWKRAKPLRSVNPLSVGAAAMAAPHVQRFLAGGGAYSHYAPVTSQVDFKGSRAAARKRMTRRQRIKRRIRKLKRFRFKRKVKRVMSKPRYIAIFTENIGRSFVSGTNRSCTVLIPVYGWKGSAVNSQSDLRNADNPAASNYNFRTDQLMRIIDFYYSNRWFPSGAAANTIVNQMWFYHVATSLDITITSNGANNEGATGTLSRVKNLEYEIYLAKPGKWLTQSDSAIGRANFIQDIVDFARAQQQRYGSASAVTYPQQADPLGDPGFTPWDEAFMKKYLKCKKIGNGYITSGSQQRFHFVRKRKRGFYSKGILDKLDPFKDDTQHGIFPKHSMFILLSFRGVPSQLSTIANPNSTIYSQGRMTIACNWRHYTYTDGSTQPGKDTYQLGPDQF